MRTWFFSVTPMTLYRKQRTRGTATGNILSNLAGVTLLVVVAMLAASLFWGGFSIHKLLAENQRLKEALTHLTREDQIGYAKVVSREMRDGLVYTRVKFVETARHNKLQRVLEKQFTLEGDVIHFDALIVKFDPRMVMDGREKALYLWRRIYGEHTAPERGFPLETPGREPRRYADLLQRLSLEERDLFWDQVWNLANTPEKLQDYGIKAVFGNVTYTKMQKGLIYVFKINPSGQIYPEIIPDM